jgi:replicative DNA helicase
MLDSEMNASAILDPVQWAAEVLDWHCLDPDGSVWARKNPLEYQEAMAKNPGQVSKYHREYQAVELRCSSKYKIARQGRQCLTGDTQILLADKTQKPISEIKIGDVVYSLDENRKLESKAVLSSWPAGIKSVYKITTEKGDVITATADHSFFVLNPKTEDNIWQSIETGLAVGSWLYHLYPSKRKYQIYTVDTKNPCQDIIKRDVSRITSVEYVGQEETYDIEVEDNHNFIANGILVHNSGKSEVMVISMLFHMFTNNNYSVLLVTPFQSQIDLIFKRLEGLISNSAVLSNSIKRSVKAPQYTIELYNGSQVKGFTAGSRSGQGASSVRGQSANYLLLDETEFLNKEDIDAIMAVITNFPDAKVWMSSTPAGKRETFYETAHDRDWKEFHFPSHVNPNWTEQLDNFYKKNLTRIGYNQEILALFSEQEQGVFQNAFVDAAIAKYEYGAQKPTVGWFYTIGVDWNSPRIGTTIYVMGFNPMVNKFMPVEHCTVQREGWTQLAACEKILELNKKWLPIAIYVDAGYGQCQRELLRKSALDARSDPERGPHHPDARLLKTLKSFDFGSTVDIRDPFTKEIRKKPAKGFLVENTVRRFESHDILIAEEDEQLKKELLGYTIKNITQAGQVVYTANDPAVGDHNLDALMLSLVAFTLEKSQLAKPTLSEKIEFTPIDTVRSSLEDTKLRVDATGKVAPMTSAAVPSGRAGNLSSEGKLQPWSWPGFGHDAPKPNTSIKSTKPSVSSTMFKRRGAPSKRSSF